MIPIQILIFFFGSVLLGGIFSGMIEMTYLGSNSGASSFAPLFATYMAGAEGDLGKVIVLVVTGDFLTGFVNLFVWNYAMFTGGWALVRLIPIVVGAAIAVHLTITFIGIARGSGT